jgi:hypothetical protein
VTISIREWKRLFEIDDGAALNRGIVLQLLAVETVMSMTMTFDEEKG